jgi:hypothetical protein
MGMSREEASRKGGLALFAKVGCEARRIVVGRAAKVASTRWRPDISDNSIDGAMEYLGTRKQGRSYAETGTQLNDIQLVT